MPQVGGKQQKLAQGKENKRQGDRARDSRTRIQQKLAQGKENKRAAEQKFRDLLTLRDTNTRTRERTADRCRR
ncbi:hypothetical protein VT84_29535 [Gemmata sp. SH-PL17]|uniref:hypothetical protein n=1 Tax=Gemmata sp. SH-PL17 TaxID=1630693 RepID=UPI0004B7522E|nr:hypothetical protein [Gemmata sp. SH-PL17]AMV28583.1 hypothetical protein VT84_29535 [Gemmata sp. SH-PL17]